MPAQAKKIPTPAALAGVSPLTRTILDRLQGETVVTMQRLEKILPEDLSVEEMDEVFLALSELGVRVVESEPKPVPAKPQEIAGTPPAAPAPPKKDEETRLPGVVAQYMAEINAIAPLTASEEEALARRVAEGDSRSANILVESHLRLVAKIAGEYRHTKMAKMDLIQAGNIGLLEAAQRYRPGKGGGRFAHFASWWVRQAITRHVEAAGLLIRLPRKLVKEIHALGRHRARMRGSLKREPEELEVAESLGWPVSKVEYLSSLGHNPLSLDSPLPRDEEKSLEEVVVDPKASEQVNVARKRLDIAKLRPLLERLSAQERSVLTLRYGIEDHVARTVGEVADLTSLSQEEVRRHERDGLQKLARLGRGARSGDDDEYD